jgi:hypothetical protein
MSRSSRRTKLAALAGMIAPLLFIATFTVEGWLRQGYDARRMFISALSLGPRGWIQILNFLFLGVAFFAFSRGVAAAFREGKASRAGHVLLTIIAFAFFASGPFVMDPMGTVREQMTAHGVLHSIFGAIVFSLAPVTCYVFWRRFRSDESWRSLRAWTLVAGVVITLAVVLLRIGTPRPPAPGNVLTGWIGLIQRTALITFLAWIFTFARVLYRAPAIRDRPGASGQNPG